LADARGLGSSSRGRGSSVGQPEGALPATVQDHIREDLGLMRDNALFFAVLAVAERLKPGSFKIMVQSPHLIERQLVNFFDNF